MARRGRVDRQLVILVITLLCGLLGALLGGLFGDGFLTVSWWLRVLAVLGGTVIGSGVAFFLLTADRPETGRWSPQPERPAPPRPPEPSQPPEPTRPSWPAVQTPPNSQPNRMTPVAHIGDRSEPETYPSTEPARIALPLPGGSAPPSNGTATRQWWAETPSAAAPSDRREPPALRRSPAPPLSSYDVESALIAQCPRCGEFRLDVSHVARAYAFQCRNASCGNTWSWTPGTPWPPVVVRRNLPGGSAPDGASAERG